MKNKHLVLLFLLVLAVGLLTQRIPWPVKKMFQTNLIELDTAGVTQISIFQPGQSELLLERTEIGWAAVQENRSTTLQPPQIAPILATLSAIRSIRIVKTTRPDTLGFLENTRLRVAVFQERKLLEEFEISYETLENNQPATFIHLNQHEGIYLVENHLRAIFSKKIDDFREKKIADFNPSKVKKIILNWVENGLDVQYPIPKNDSTGKWEPLKQASREISDDSIQTWLSLFSLLNDSPFADNFDESRARKTLLSQIRLQFMSSDSLIFKMFYVKPPDLPEEIDLSKNKNFSVYVLHSSQNPSNFFAPTDTSLLREIFFKFKPPTDTTIVSKRKERKK